MKYVLFLMLGLYSSLQMQAQSKSANRLPSTSAVSQVPIVPRTLHSPEYYIGKTFSGLWLSRYPNGQVCDSGYLDDGRPAGVWKSWYPDGQLRVMMECSAKRLSATKEEMNRIYKPGFPPGPGMVEMKKIMTDNTVPYDKLLYRQMYLSIHPPGLEFQTPELEVTVKTDDSTNTFFTNALPYTECLVHGVYKSWFPDGRIKDSGSCDDGIREGVWEEWSDDGTIRSVGFYRNGLRWKDWRYYNQEGKLLYIRWFNRSEEVTETIVLK